MRAKCSREQSDPQLLHIHLAYKVKNGMFALGEFTAVYVKGEKNLVTLTYKDGSGG